MNTIERIQHFEQRIEQIKAKLAAVGLMRPGSLSKQSNVCGKAGCRCKDPLRPQKHGPYYQLSYVHQGKSTTQFIRPFLLPEVKQQLSNYKTFRRLTAQWITLALKIAKTRLKLASRQST